jgi:predicted membrane-bound spermidine synthase
MSLKAFHIVFITLSTALAIGFGLSSFHDYQMHGGGTAAISLTVAGFVAAAGLLSYGVWFLKKLKDVSFL